MQEFADGKLAYNTFSPVFKPHKAGNVVNMGNINANDVLLIGNKVSIDGGNIHGKHNEGVSDEALKNPSGNTANKIHLVGNEVNILVDGIKSDSIIASAYVKGSLQQSTTSYYNYDNNIGKLNFITQEYDNIDKTNLGNKKLVTKDKFEKHATIGSDIDWWHFAKGWNENKNNMRVFFDTYKLVDDIDFGASEGKNYANYCIDGLGCTSMIVGRIYDSPFTKTFDGQGYTLSNINIDTTVGEIKDKPLYVGIFGLARRASFSNINIDYMNGGINASSSCVGGFIGIIDSGIYSSITINNIKEINNNDKSHTTSVGGFAGWIDEGTFCNISINKINKIYNIGESSYTGGFAGQIARRNPYFEQIIINNIDSIKSESDSIDLPTTLSGGFAGHIDSGKYNSIAVMGVDEIIAISTYVGDSGGFAGWIGGGKYNNIAVMGVDEIIAHRFDSLENYGSTLSAGGFAGSISGANLDFSSITLNNIENITANSKSTWGEVSSGGFAGSIYDGKFNNISLNHIQNIESSYTPENEDEWSAKQVNAGGFTGRIYQGNLENISIYDVKNIHAINNAQYHGSDIESSGSHAGGFVGYIGLILNNHESKFNNIYMYFTPNSIIKSESKLNENYAGKFAGRISVSDNTNPDISKIHIYHHKKDLTNATADQKYWGNEIQLHPYDDNNQGYIDFKTAALAALNGLKEIDCGAGRKCLVFTSDFKIEDIINEQATLDTDDIISKNDLEEQIIADLKDKFYIVNINILDELLKAYSKIDKNNPTSKAEFLANYLLSKDKYPDDKERLDIAHSMIQSLDFLLAYQDNGLSEASDDKFANKDTKDTNSKVTNKVVKVYNQTNANKDQVNHFIQTTLNNKVNSINEANKNFSEKNYYEEINTLALAYNKYVELINKGLANKNDQAFKDISNRLFALIAQAQGETKTIEELINSFEDLKTQASEKSNGHFIVEGDLQALNIPYPILASIKDNNNGSGEIDKPEKPIDPIEPPIDNKPDFSLSFEQSSTFNSIGNDSLDDEEEQEEIEEASMNQKGKTCIVSDNYRTMNPCVVGSF
ncbi:hypothetical protein A0Y69_03295 [Campylobacter lari]|nr:hypothetical protein [Campylobacter lari]